MLVPAFMESPSFLLRATLGERLAQRLVGLGVDLETALQCAAHVAAQDGLFDAIDTGRSVVLFTRDRFSPQLHPRATSRRAAAELADELGLNPEYVCAIDIGPMLHHLRWGAEHN